jgi:predicted HD phosphohydrolase
MLCQSEFISDSKCLVVSWAISCRICNCVRMSLRGTRQSQHAIHYYFISFFVGTRETLVLAGGTSSARQKFFMLCQAKLISDSHRC